MEGVEKMAGRFSCQFPGVMRFSGGRDLHCFGKTGRARRHAFLKVGPVMGQPVFALEEGLGEFRGFAIALEAEGYVAGVFCDHYYMGTKVRFDLSLLFVGLDMALECVAVGQVVSGTEVVAPRGWSLSGGGADEG